MVRRLLEIASGKPAKTMRVLVVDDDPALCEVFGEFLHEIGHQPVIAYSAEPALDTIKSTRPDAVLLDVCLPGMSGLDFLKLDAVRDMGVPIVVISGRATETQAQECLRAGAFDFIGKPVALERLEEALACFETLPGSLRASDPSGAERRRAPRATLVLPVRVREQSGAEWESTSVHVSTSGIKMPANGSRPHPRPAKTVSITPPDRLTPPEGAARFLPPRNHR